MLPLILAALNRGYNGGATIPIKDCKYKGEHPKASGLGFRVQVWAAQAPSNMDPVASMWGFPKIGVPLYTPKY